MNGVKNFISFLSSFKKKILPLLGAGGGAVFVCLCIDMESQDDLSYLFCPSPRVNAGHQTQTQVVMPSGCHLYPLSHLPSPVVLFQMLAFEKNLPKGKAEGVYTQVDLIVLDQSPNFFLNI